MGDLAGGLPRSAEFDIVAQWYDTVWHSQNIIVVGDGVACDVSGQRAHFKRCTRRTARGIIRQ